MKITSPDFEHDGMIPKEFTCDGDDINPQLRLADVPDKTKSLVLIVDDPDAPGGNWDHWIVYDIPSDTRIIEQDSVPGTEAQNDFQRQSYGGPCPPSGTHRYLFKAYAIDTLLELDPSVRKKAVESAMKGHILAKAELIGRYTRS